jgi:hypothetical protein
MKNTKSEPFDRQRSPSSRGELSSLVSDSSNNLHHTQRQPSASTHMLSKDASSLESLRVPFRRFAVASDEIVGGDWTRDGQTLILGRARSHSQQIVPPLRFETFALLATQSTNELAQSYERNAVFAGKLATGEHKPNRLCTEAQRHRVHSDKMEIGSKILVRGRDGRVFNITDQISMPNSVSNDIGGVDVAFLPGATRCAVQQAALESSGLSLSDRVEAHATELARAVYKIPQKIRV